MEPSFGGCTFLSALQRRFLALGAPAPWGQMFGCDVASAAFRTHLARIIPSSIYSENFVKADFLTLTPASFGAQLFQAALGNPPYVSYHNMFKVQRSAAAKAGFDDDFRVPLLPQTSGAILSSTAFGFLHLMAAFLGSDLAAFYRLNTDEQFLMSCVEDFHELQSYLSRKNFLTARVSELRFCYVIDLEVILGLK